MPACCRLCLLLALAGALARTAVAGEPQSVAGCDFQGVPAPSPDGGRVLCTNVQESSPFGPVLAAAVRILKPKAVLRFESDRFESLRGDIETHRPEEVVILAPPETLDLTFHLKVLAVALAVDADPFLDFLPGYVTAATPEEGIRFLTALLRASALKARFPRTAMEVGPGIASRLDAGSPASWCPRLRFGTLLHAEPTFLHRNRSALEGVGMILLFGEGSPWGIESGMEGTFLRQSALRLQHALVLSGEDRLGTVDYYYPDGTGAKARRIDVAQSFCLAAISREPAALLLPLGPGLAEGAAVAMERMCLFGDSVGAAWKAGIDDAVLAFGAADARAFLRAERWAKPAETPPVCRAFSPALFGLPEFTPYPGGLAPPPLTARVKADADGVEVVAAVKNPAAVRLFTDVLDAEAARDRILFSVPLPAGTESRCARLLDVEVKVGRSFCKLGKVCAAQERWGERVILHVRLELESPGGQRPLANAPSAEVKLVFGP